MFETTREPTAATTLKASFARASTFGSQPAASAVLLPNNARMPQLLYSVVPGEQTRRRPQIPQYDHRHSRHEEGFSRMNSQEIPSELALLTMSYTPTASTGPHARL